MNDSITNKINELKEKRNAVILAHNYQQPEVQDIADFTGDSLDLSRRAAQTDKDVIVFCGVHFMAETAYILSPNKTVLLPDMMAGCPMANMINAAGLRELKEKHPGFPVVCYINTSAEVKAESTICCTSANAVKIVNSIDSKYIIFIPDKNLGHYCSLNTDKKFVFWDGYCNVHTAILIQRIDKAKQEHPKAEVLVHPECKPDVIQAADKVLSTNAMCRYVKGALSSEFIIGTETGIIHRLKKENPFKHFFPASEYSVCPNMKKINLEKILWALEDMDCKVIVEEEIRIKAKKCIDKMLEIGI
ncbi:MAG: quinolinate synthase NadA [Planctomycetota bacterium]